MLTLYTTTDLDNYKKVVEDLQAKLLQADSSFEKGDFNTHKPHEVFSAEIIVKNKEVEIWIAVYKFGVSFELKVLKNYGSWHLSEMNKKYSKMFAKSME